MDIPFKCPECKGTAIVLLTDDEAKNIKVRIKSEGRSPTLIVKCENGHELLVTLYNLRLGDGLGVRDVIMPHRQDPQKEKGCEDKEVDWLKGAFGG